MQAQKVNIINTYMGKLPHKSDLITALTDFCIEKEITSGKIEAIGAVMNAALQYKNVS